MRLLFVGPCLVLRNVGKVESTSQILFRRSLVGGMSCIPKYQFISTASAVQHSCKLVHNLSQSAEGWSCTMRITRGGLPTSAIPRSVQHTTTPCPKVFTQLVGIYARHFLDVGTQVFDGGGICPTWEGLSRFLCSLQYLCHPSIVAPSRCTLKPDRHQECLTFHIYLNQTPTNALFSPMQCW